MPNAIGLGAVGAALALGLGLLPSAGGAPPATRPELPAPGPSLPAAPECAAGCAALEREDEAEPVDVDALVETWRSGSAADAAAAVDALLFHREEAGEWLGRAGERDAVLRALLERELARSHALLELRIVDEAGAVRAHLTPTAMPLGQREHLHPERVAGLQVPEISGTVRRVGLGHLWARL
ncbi:MAG: hypothetical protein AAF682_20135 [Planctomycetota bacterium]